MKLFTFFFFIVTLQISAKSYSQNIYLKGNSISLKRAFEQIESQTGYSFFINQKLLKNAEPVSISLRNATIGEAMEALLKGQPLTYEVIDKTVILKEKQEVLVSDILASNRRIIRGVVKDAATGELLMGVSITIKGSNTGTVTDGQGKFELEVLNGAELEVTYLGYAPTTITTTGKISVEIMLTMISTSLDQMVVVGYGTMRKKDLTGSVVQIRPDNLVNENPNTVQDILRGTAGLKVGYNVSAKGGGAMELRGQRSVYTGGRHNEPLIVLDGMIFYGELSEINPDDIGQIDILKDASAAAVYGAKAASGVIIISTKKGKIGKPVVNFTANASLSTKANFRERFGMDDYLQHRQDWYTKNTYGVNPTTGVYEAYQTGVYANRPGYFANPNYLPEGISINTWRAYTSNGGDESDLSIWGKRLEFRGNALTNFLAGKTVDWSGHFFQTAFNQDYNASISGANEKTNYYLSMGNLDNEGVQSGDKYKAVRANMKVQTKVNKWLEVGANVNFQDRKDGNIVARPAGTLQNSIFADYADENGNPVQYPLSTEYSQRGYNFDFEKQYAKVENGNTVINSILNAKVSLPFNITYAFNFSPRYQFFYDRYFMSADLPNSNPKERGVNRQQAKYYDWSLNNTITWDYVFNKKHRVNLTLVQEAEERWYWKDNIEARNILPSDALGFHHTENASKENSSFWSNDIHETADGLLGRLFYSYDDRYLLTTSLRRDGYSAFGGKNPHATFPSVSGAWSFSNEKGYNWHHIMNTGKLRVSYGENGNRSLADPYLALANLSVGGGRMQGYINSSGDLVQYRFLVADRMANPNLKWEKTNSWNLGLDFGFLNDKISGSIDLYSMSTRDMIMNQRLPEFTGFSSITTNLGQVDNRGIEVAVKSLNINNSNLQWFTTLNFSYNKNSIKHLYYEYEDVLDEAGNVVGTKEMDDTSNGWFIGKAISTIWDYRVTGIWQADEIEEARKYGQAPGDPKIANNYTADDVINTDGSITPVYNDKDKDFLGQTAPPVQWSLRNEFVLYKNLNISFNIYSYMGHKSVSDDFLNNDDSGGKMSGGLATAAKKEYWTIDNPSNEFPRIEAKGPTGVSTSRKVYDRSFIRLENISAAYTLPKNWIAIRDINSIKVFGSIRNVTSWSKGWKYVDPEINDIVNGFGIRTFSLGLNVNF